MRAAEAMLLGSKLLKPRARLLFSQGGEAGCALGMIMKANGADAVSILDLFERFPECSYAKLYPWLMKPIVDRSPCSCGCCADHWLIACYIAAIFNVHVAGDHTWTIEKLADWVESMDPTPKDEPVEKPVETVKNVEELVSV